MKEEPIINQKNKRKVIVSKSTALMILGLILLVFAVPLGVVTLTSFPVEQTALFGDSYGWVNAAFSAAAFAGIIYTVLLQRQELELQRNELEMTRSELTRSASAQERSELALAKQAESLLLAAQINATVAQINVIDVAMTDLRHKGVLDGANERKMRDERTALRSQLAELGKRAAAMR